MTSTRTGPLRRWVTAAYDAHAGGRSPVLDGPWWVGLGIAAATLVVVLVDGPWRWAAVPVLVAFLWAPLGVRWARAVAGSRRAWKEELRR